MGKANQVREHAAYIRNNPNNAQAVADALDVIADAMDGKCEDCGQQVEQLQGIIHQVEQLQGIGQQVEQIKDIVQQVEQLQGIGIDAPDVGAGPMGADTNVGA